MSFSSKLSAKSVPAYALWRLSGCAYPITLQMAGGPRLQFHSKTSTDRDYGTAYEIFVHGYYDVPDSFVEKSAVALVVDLGANVGFSCLHWLALYPNAKVIAFEPHPVHVRQLGKNLALNRWESRVEIHAAAAGTRAGNVRLSDAGTSSSVQRDECTGIEVPMEDFFERCGRERIDIAKIDIEGGEYALLRDERFAGLDVKLLIMEWHQLGESGEDGRWCNARLEELGYETSLIFDAGTHGMLRAHRRAHNNGPYN